MISLTTLLIIYIAIGFVLGLSMTVVENLRLYKKRGFLRVADAGMLLWFPIVISIAWPGVAIGLACETLGNARFWNYKIIRRASQED